MNYDLHLLPVLLDKRRTSSETKKVKCRSNNRIASNVDRQLLSDVKRNQNDSAMDTLVDVLVDVEVEQ